MMQDEMDLNGPEQDCPGYDKCPVSMCGCRWLATGEAFRGENEHDSNLPQ
jgi:hypothetical protein